MFTADRIRNLANRICRISTLAAIALLGAGSWTIRATADAGLTFVRGWGEFGYGNSQFAAPNGIALTPTGYVYVVDTIARQVKQFDTTGVFLRSWGGSGTGAGRFSAPIDVEIDQDGNVYVTDTGLHEIQKFTSDGQFVTEWGSFGSSPGQFDGGPYGVAVDDSNQVYVCDGARVQVFESNGAFLRGWGKRGTGPGEFEGSYGIAVGPGGTIYVTDTNNKNVQAFTRSGTFMFMWGSYGTAPGQFHFPFEIAVDATGDVYVGDYEAGRVQRFSSQGAFLGDMTTSGQAQGEFLNPAGLGTVGPYLFLVDEGAYRVQVFVQTSVSAFPTSWGRVKAMWRN